MRVVAITHGPNVGPGVFGTAVEEAGHELEEWCVPLGAAPPEGADAYFVFGGAMHPDQDEHYPWLGDEHRFLVDVLERGTPLLGVCLGAQMVARAAGAAVRPAPEAEVGWLPVELSDDAADDPVFASLPRRFEAFEWHHYTYDVPAGAAELARSAACTQAFRLGNAWAIQFHAEVTEPQIEEWLLQDHAEVPDVAALRAATRRQIGAWNQLGKQLARSFVDTAAG
jgi:GMP synthase-like glutamine amidotransferase